MAAKWPPRSKSDQWTMLADSDYKSRGSRMTTGISRVVFFW
jgi:hypothetical protein